MDQMSPLRHIHDNIHDNAEVVARQTAAEWVGSIECEGGVFEGRVRVRRVGDREDVVEAGAARTDRSQRTSGSGSAAKLPAVRNSETRGACEQRAQDGATGLGVEVAADQANR
jgi:hypothetical protein